MQIELDLARQDVDDAIAELERLLHDAEEAYELMAWEHENENRDSD